MATRVVFSRKASALVDQREERRHRVEGVLASADAEAERPFAAVLQDISTFGCRLSDVPALEPGQRLWLRLPGAPPLLAKVAWCRDGVAGCRFDAPISSALMRSLLPGAA